MAPSLEDLRPRVESALRSIHDFPIKGINFRDIMPMMKQPRLVSELCAAIADHVKLRGAVNAVAGLEARGFLFGPQIAAILDVPFVPIRKKGKLPGDVVRATYVKEYGEDVVEIQADALNAGDRVLIVDDLLATGGTLAAAIDLIGKAGGVVAEAFIIIELAGLNGRAKLDPAVNTYALITYPDA